MEAKMDIALAGHRTGSNGKYYKGYRSREHRDLWGSVRVGSKDWDLGSSSFGVYMECPDTRGHIGNKGMMGVLRSVL